MKSSSLLAGLLALMIACGVSFGAGYYVARDQAAESPNSRPVVAAGDSLDEKPTGDDKPLTAPEKSDKDEVEGENTPDTNNKHVKPEKKPEGSTPTAETKPNESNPGGETVEAKPAPGTPTEGDPKALDDQLKDLKDKIRDLKVDDLENFDDIFNNGPKVDFSATVSGQVVDANGTPVAGATVHGSYSENYSSDGEGRRISFVVATGESSGPAIATTDAGGNFTANISRKVSEKASLQASLTATADGFAESKKESFNLKNGDTKEGVKLVLRGAGSVTGRVVDGSGAGVEGVSVSLNPAGGGGFYGEGVDIDFTGSGKGKYNATTDIGGNFTIEGVPEGRYKFKLSGAGYRQISGPTEMDVKSGQSQRAPTDFQVAVTASIAATLQDVEGKPLRGWATVKFTDDNGKVVKQLSGPVDSNGGFEKNDPPAGSYNVEIKLWGYKPYTTRVTLLEGQRYDFGALTLEADTEGGGSGGIFIPDEE